MATLAFAALVALWLVGLSFSAVRTLRVWWSRRQVGQQSRQGVAESFGGRHV